MASVDEIWLTDFGDPYPGEPAHRRPSLVIGPAGTFGADFPFVIVCPIITRRRGLSIHVEVEPGHTAGLDEMSYVQCELIRSINRGRLVHRLGTIDTMTSARVHEIMRTLLNH